jgi:hypothetical protein
VRVVGACVGSGDKPGWVGAPHVHFSAEWLGWGVG